MMYIVINKEIEMKVVADVSRGGKIPWWITDGKEYSAAKRELAGCYADDPEERFIFSSAENMINDDDLDVILDDSGSYIIILLSSCAHLYGGTWRIMEE